MHRTKKEQEIIEGLKPVCICKGIRTRVFQERIKAGLTTVEELKKSDRRGVRLLQRGTLHASYT